MFERFTSESRRVVEDARREARQLGHDWLGTEHLLLALFDRDTVARRALEALGVRREVVADDLLKMLSRNIPDPDSLGTLGIDLDEVVRRAEEAFGPGSLERTTAWGRSGSRGGSVCFTPRSKKALQLAVREALVLGHRSMGPEHILLGLVRDRETLAAELLSRRGGSPAVVRQAVLEELRRPA